MASVGIPPVRVRKRVEARHVLLLAALLAVLVLILLRGDPVEIGRPLAEDTSIYVNEFLVANRTSVVDEDGDLSDWIEILNSGDQPRSLEGYWLSDKADDPFKWRFPDATIGPGEYLLIFASGKDRRAPESQLHTNFKLNDTNDDMVFSNAQGHVIDEFEIRDQVTNVSYGRVEGNPEVWLYFPQPTPGQPNYTQDAEGLSGKSLKEGSKIRLNEVMAMNIRTLADEDRDYPDWIELYNSGEESVNLKGFGLSDKLDEPFLWVFPEVTLEPGRLLVVFASGKDRRDPAGRFLHTNFRLGASGETLLLSNALGQAVDVLTTGKLLPDMSSGRYPDGEGGRDFFPRPTPGSPNLPSDLSGYAPQPLLSQPGGFFDSGFSLYMEVRNPPQGAVIRYTLNGAHPSESSPLYSGPISIEATTVVRARTFAPGLLPSLTTNQTFFVNDGPTLTAISILIDPHDLMDPVHGIYSLGYNASPIFPYKGANFWLDREKPIHFQLFEPNGKLGLSYDLGIKIGGQYSRAMPQKTLNVYARDRYGYSVMEYPFFPGYELTTHKALTLRTSGQDATMSKMRDIMMSSLLSETDLDYQHYRIAVVYINGQYWGVYNIRERVNEYFVAYKHDVDPDKVDLLQANWTVRTGNRDDYMEIYEFVRLKNMRITENYEYVKTRIDVENYMDYIIAQVYFANTDSANIRFWRERTEGAKWRWIVYDLDWGFFSLNHNTLASLSNPAGTGWAQALNTVFTRNLILNDEFRRQFIERFAYHMNYTFTPERVLDRIDEIAAVLEPEMPRHFQRWGGSMSSWHAHVEGLRDFARKRPAIVLKHIQSKFGLSNEEMSIFDAWGN